MEKLPISEQLMYSTIRIVNHSSKSVSTGTGFFYNFEIDGNTIPTIVTNKHVVEGAETLNLIFTQSSEDGTPLNTRHIPCNLNDIRGSCIYHPEPDIDLCVILIGSILNQLIQIGIRPFYVNITEEFIPKNDDFKAIEDIVMIGYPNSLWDSTNNLPIFRRGITATHPSFNYRGKEEFMVDAAIYGGSSGSPVFIFNEGGYADRSGNVNFGKPRVIFMGVLYAGPVYNVKGEIQILEVPMDQTQIVNTSLPINLGLVIKSHKINDFKDVIRGML